jgi:hypothetical protein
MAYPSTVDHKTIPNPFKNPKLTLVSANPQAKGKYAKLSFDLYNNNPRLVVATNDPTLQVPEKGYGRITAALDTPAFFSFIELLKEAINNKEPSKFKIENFGMQKGGDPKVPAHLTDLWVGRGEDGAVFVSVISKADGYPVIKFVFAPSDSRYHKYYHGNGSEFSKAELSNLHAKAYVTILEEIMSNLLVSNYVEPAPYQGNKGGYNNNRGGQGGYQKPAYNNQQPQSYPGDGAADTDGDAIPF